MRAARSLAVALILAARAASANPAEDAARRFVEARGLEARQAIDAVMGQTRVMDHDIRETWHRRLETPEAVYRFGATIHR